MKILFVDNLLLPEKGDIKNLDIHPHLGLLSLVAVANKAGFDASIVDPKLYIVREELDYDQNLYAKFADILLAQQPDVIGFTTLGCSFIFALSVAEILKELREDIPILLGGPHATILHRLLLERFSCFDVVVRNEAENTLVPILESLETMEFGIIPGVTWRKGNQVFENAGAPTVENVDKLIFPAYHEYPIRDLKLDSIRVDAGRGCPFKCTFCSTASFFGRTYRLKSPEKLIGELDELHRVYGFTDFKLNHDLFTVNRKKVIAFCEAIRDRGYTWGVSARVDCVDEELLQLMWDAGCRGIYFGLETGSERMQKISQKKLKLDLVEPILEITEKLGMRTIVSFITGYPEETESDQDATLDMLGLCFKRNRSLFSTQLHMLTPEPGTALDAQYGKELQYDGYVTDFNALSLRERDSAMILNNPEVFMTYHYYPTQLSRKRHIFVVESYRKFRKAGHTILIYLLRFYEGRFSKLIRAFENWFNENEYDVEPEIEHILEFIQGSFGQQHHVNSLLRYALVTEASRKLDTPLLEKVEKPIFMPDQKYHLAGNVYLFENLHSCAELIDRIQQNVQSDHIFAENEVGELGYHLVIGKSVKKDGAMENFEINQATFWLADLLRTPISYLELCSALRPILKDNLPTTDMFEGLLEIGAIELVSDESLAPVLSS